MTLPMTLDAFLEHMAATRFADGVNDCALTVADWAVAATGCADPAAHLRGRYRTALGRERLLRRLGGLEAVIADCAARAGLAPTETPRRGDIGLIEVAGCQMAAIRVGGHWAVQSTGGLSGLRPDRIVRAWRVAHA